MVYKRKTEFADIDYGNLVNAVKAVKVGNVSKRAAAVQFNIERNSMRRYLKNIREKRLRKVSHVNPEKSPPKKASKSNQSSMPEPLTMRLRDPQPTAKQYYDEEDIDFCIICLKDMPSKLTKFNSIACDKCGREVHLKCAKMTGSWYTCPRCIDPDSN